MQTATPTLRKSLEQRVEQAILDVLHRVATLDARRVSIEDQRRHLGRMLTCQVSLMGTGWIGSLILLVPSDASVKLTQKIAGCAVEAGPKGADIAQAMGTLTAAIGLAFGKSFNDEESITVGMPTVLAGGDVAVSFPWGKDFESRQCFATQDHALWAILRLSHTNR